MHYVPDQTRVFDWDEAARLILSHNLANAAAGLGGDWGNTGGEIYRDKTIVPQEETHTFLASDWAIPQIRINGEVIDNYKEKWQRPDWNSRTYWPESARAILHGRSD